MLLPVFVSLALSTVPFSLAKSAKAGYSLPSKVYGVNIGNWLIFEPWMAESEWATMGGGNCSNCTQCIATER
jgi:hypothetical protein